MQSIDQQYLDVCNDIMENGTLSHNNRTGLNTKFKINVDLEYNQLPILLSKKCAWKSAIAEILGYLKGHSSAAQFRDEGTKTWDANANLNDAWLHNRFRKGEDDMGLAYRFRDTELTINDTIVNVDQVRDVVYNLIRGVDDRGLIMTAWLPHTFMFSCLRPCMHTYQFSIDDDTLHLNSFQRSADMPLGVPFNMIQCYALLMIMAKLSNKKIGTVYHKIVNAHVYENQFTPMLEQISRKDSLPECKPTLTLNKDIKTNNIDEAMLNIDELTVDNFELNGYSSLDAIKYEFAI